ncbi:hypothetical protein [Sulfobacillus harzensis]|uniref:Uncharacterized protein n=1 Tax=Sulfobacillus harzensis TaxID=2729629 RepID=A0A7Y0L5S7_9FIRM|nr:hypothetical protein [Sulfobacillus harzensis]NMP23261.1 hypothetical protein [Sulfobacillus harzensis]
MGSIRQLKVGRAHTDKTAPLLVPLLFWGTGVFGILVGLWRLTVVARPLLLGMVGAGSVLEAVHSFTLAGFTMVMMGALYQLIPVLLNVPPVPGYRAFVQWGVYTLGLIGFLLGLYTGRSWLLETGGVGVVLGILLFLGNVGGRLVQRTTFNVTAWFFVTALGYLLLTVMMGGLLVVRYTTGHPSFPHEVPVHMTIALGGWFGLLVSGTSYRLWAMFGLKHREPQHWFVTWALANGAIVLWAVSLVSGIEVLRVVGWLFQGAGFLVYVAAIVSAGLGDVRTMRDPALRTLLLSLGALGAFEVLGTWAIFGHAGHLWIPAWIAYGLGWVGMSFLGFAQKIVPFMIWLHRYAHVHGQGKMPRLQDIWRPGLAYPPMMAVGLGLLFMLLAFTMSSVWLLRLGGYLAGLGWLFLLGVGIRVVRGPHRRPE